MTKLLENISNFYCLMKKTATRKAHTYSKVKSDC